MPAARSRVTKITRPRAQTVSGGSFARLAGHSARGNRQKTGECGRAPMPSPTSLHALQLNSCNITPLPYLHALYSASAPRTAHGFFDPPEGSPAITRAFSSSTRAQLVHMSQPSDLAGRVQPALGASHHNLACSATACPATLMTPILPSQLTRPNSGPRVRARRCPKCGRVCRSRRGAGARALE
jgi:hypothetical protein